MSRYIASHSAVMMRLSASSRCCHRPADSRVAIVVPRATYIGTLLVNGQVDIWDLLRKPGRFRSVRQRGRTSGMEQYLIPASMPLNPAPMTMTLMGLYSSIAKSPRSILAGMSSGDDDSESGRDCLPPIARAQQDTVLGMRGQCFVRLYSAISIEVARDAPLVPLPRQELTRDRLVIFCDKDRLTMLNWSLERDVGQRQNPTPVQQFQYLPC